MNKNKIIFAAIWIVILLIFVYILKTISSEKQSGTQAQTWGWVVLWTLDNADQFTTFLWWFRENFPQYQNSQIDVVSFSNYTEYYHALIGAFLWGRGPDLFVLNNSEWKYFDAQLYPSSPDIIDVDTFRNEFDLVFSKDLIEVIPSEESNIELLRWIPLWYQPMGMFYNFRELRWENLTTWSYINDLVNRFSQEWKTLLWIWDGQNVAGIADIITQFFVQDNLAWVWETKANEFAQALTRYQMYGDRNAENKFTNIASWLTSTQNNVDLFTQGQVQILFGYPSLLEQIDKKWYNKSFLRASVFPTYTPNSGNILVDYNYFVINKNTQNMWLSQDLMRYFASEVGQKSYLDIFAYYLPSRLSLLPERLEKNIKDGYPLKYKDFYDSWVDMVSFYKWNKELFDRNITKIIDDSINGRNLFENFRKTILCISNKMITWENLWTSCE